MDEAQVIVVANALPLAVHLEAGVPLLVPTFEASDNMVCVRYDC